MHRFEAAIDIIGINPFVFVPDAILTDIFAQAGTSKGPIPIRGTVNGQPYSQTLVRYQGHWRLYINTLMLKNSPKRIGETITLTLAFDPADRTLTPHPRLVQALADCPAAQEVFDGLPASRRKEIVRYIASLKTEESIHRNVGRAIDFLLGNGRFIGRDKP
ncbi:YdeI/OmpD-associated family protein [Hymenobacter sp. B81]|uniref:YdeI/OmpD-associated family protein n=1 Tax=Hymenobacter sp. B81 TaxID=3344878 RepID=UPI0037DCC117